MFDQYAWRRRQLSQFPPWLARDLGLDASTIDAIVARPSVWSRIHGFVHSRRGDGMVAAPQPLSIVRPYARVDRDESAAA